MTKTNVINLKVRVRNPVFWVQIVGTFIMCALAYNQMEPQDLTTWNGLFSLVIGAVKNPYCLVLCVWNIFNAINDPTTQGLTDSERAKGYEKPYAD